MKKRVLITNLDSYIGQELVSKIRYKSYDIFAFYPAGQLTDRYSEFKDKISLLPLTISNTLILKKHLSLNQYDTIIHIPEFHTKRCNNRTSGRIANVFATQQIIEHCLQTGATLIYCSSVSVYGNTPFELPSHDLSEKVAIGYRAKMVAEIESIIEQNRLKGLKAVILRPSLLYGINSKGFVRTLINLIKLNLLPKTTHRTFIHLCNIDLLVSVLEQAITNEECIGRNYNVADSEPVILNDLLNYIKKFLANKKYKTALILNLYIGRNLANLFYRFNFTYGGYFLERLTHNWFYDIEDLVRDFTINRVDTIPAISDVINS